MGSRKLVYTMIYGMAKSESQVHWHHRESPRLLREVVATMHGSGRALDIGCGTGEDSIFLAQQGLSVTALDFVPRALDFARAHAEEYGVRIEFIRADILEYELEGSYDLILDSGCLHTIDERNRPRYKRSIISSMHRQSNYLLLHSTKTNLLDLGFGPRPKTKDQIAEFFMPELKLVDFEARTGGKPMSQFWFRWDE